jgi:hypothetical protein
MDVGLPYRLGNYDCGYNWHDLLFQEKGLALKIYGKKKASIKRPFLTNYGVLGIKIKT